MEPLLVLPLEELSGKVYGAVFNVIECHLQKIPAVHSILVASGSSGVLRFGLGTLWWHQWSVFP